MHLSLLPQYHPASVSVIIDRPAFTLKTFCDSEIIEMQIKAEIIFDHIAAMDAKKTLERLKPGQKCHLMVSSEGFFRVTKKARKLGADKAFSAHLSAVACHTSYSSLALIGELYTKINKPAVPTRVFHSREAAMDWLSEQLQALQSNTF
jgi:hypothetical protein